MAYKMNPLHGQQLTSAEVVIDTVTFPELIASPKTLSGTASASRIPALFTRSGYTSVVKQTAPKLPADAVAKGDGWAAKHEFDSAFGAMAQETKYEYVGPSKRGGATVEQIKVSGQLRVLQAKKDARGELKSQSMTGELFYDPALGVISESMITQELGTERPYRGTVIKVDSLSTLRMTVKE